MDMKKYVISRTNNANFLLSEFAIEDVCGTQSEAEAAASDLTVDSGVNHFIFEVDMKLVSTLKAVRSVELKRLDSPK